MASLNGFIRRSPPDRLRRYLEARRVEIGDDFDWNSYGLQKDYLKAVSTLLSELPDRHQDRVRAELDLLAHLSDDKGMQGTDRVCAGQEIDLEGLEGKEDTLLMIAIEHPQLLDRIALEASLVRRYGGRDWAAFQFLEDGNPWGLDDDDARAEFLGDAVSILNLPAHRKRDDDWYKTIRVDPVTGEETEIVQATIYLEERAESELAFGSSASLERRIVPKVLEVGISCIPRDRVIEVCAKGGKKTRDRYAEAFAKRFAPQSKMPVEIPRRDVLLNVLSHAPEFDIEPADGIARVEVSSLDFISHGGGFTRIERRGEGETIYQFITRRFGGYSPLTSSGWEIWGATLRIVLAPTEGLRSKTLTVTLKRPNTTTLPNKTERDRQFVLKLLERWKLIAPSPQDDNVIEAA